MRTTPFLLLCVIILWSQSCMKVEANIDQGDDENIEMYFPPSNSDEWETLQAKDLDWNEDQIESLYEFLEENDTRAFVVLSHGKIVLEKYWGNNFLNNTSFTQNTIWYWASAAKTITASLIGIAQEENLLKISDPSSVYLGKGWTNLPEEKEDLISIRHHLTMSTGLDYDVDDQNCLIPTCFNYRSDAGTLWYYYNAPYLITKEIVSQATGVDYTNYTDTKLVDKIGMDGSWLGDNLESLFWSTARDMSRFGHLILNEGTWKEEEIISREWVEQMTNQSQDLNPSYGYLWWLNDKSSIIYPGLPQSFNLELAPNAPDDMISAIGKNGQFLNVVPSKNLVVVRMGNAPEASLVPVEFHDKMWEKINLVIGD